MAKKKYDNGLSKTELSEDGTVINFSIKVSDLALLIKNSPEYCEQYVKRGEEAEFVDYILGRLSEPSGHDDTEKWSISFEDIFLSILEGAFKKQIPVLPGENDCCIFCNTYLKDDNDVEAEYCFICGQSISW